MYSGWVFAVLFGILWISSVNCEIFRLPRNVKPVRYTLTMEPHLESDLDQPVPFNGSVVMELEVFSNTRNITFNTKVLEIDSSSITINSNTEEIKVTSTSEDEADESYTVQVEKELIKGERYNLTIGNFFGKLLKGRGFFLIKYFHEDTSEIEGAAVTQFEPTGARLAFPCFDEPAIRASFIVNLIRKEGYNSLSNEELERTEDLGDGRFKDIFKETPTMPTYLVAFTISKFKSTERVDRNKIFARSHVFNNPQTHKQLNYSLWTAVKAVRHLEEYTGITFALNKLDHFAIPHGNFDFEAAMENWGLIVYSEPFLISTPMPFEFPAEAIKRSSTAIVHEIAHQWFGNLVTSSWWDYLWLNESFAAYFHYYITSLIQPSWKMMEQLVIDLTHEALNTEEYSGAHPLTFRIKKSGTMPPPYILYQKGPAILRMFESSITPDVFRRGLQIYLEKGKFSATVPGDLYKALQKAVDEAGVNDLLHNLTVAEILDTWTTNKGFPLVTVTRNYTSGSITIEQEPKSPFWDVKKHWKIPVNYVFSSEEKVDFSHLTADYWLTEQTATIDNSFPTDGWLIINKQQTGYYRVNYDLENWERIIQFLNSDNFKSIHKVNRAQLISDAFNLAKNDKIPDSVPLRLCEYLSREKDYIPWAAFASSIHTYKIVRFSGGKVIKYPYEYFKEFSSRYNLNSTLSERKVFAKYLKVITKELYSFYKAHDDYNVDTHLEGLLRNKLMYLSFMM